MIGLFAMQYFSATSGLSTVLWAATMIAVIVRLAMSVRENKALLEQVRTDPLTGLGNRGRDAGRPRPALRERRREEQPVLAAPLRPQRLQALQRHLRPPGRRRAAGPARAPRCATRSASDGTAYRIGGDEFCLLLTCPPERFDAVDARPRQRADRRPGTGFDVSASWGSVEIPAEALDPDEALQLADVRMYAQKESRRAAITVSAPGAPGVTPAAAPSAATA